MIISSNALKGALVVLLAVAFLAIVVWCGAPQKRFWLGFLFLTAPFDVSKAVVPPLSRFYSPGLYVTVGQAAMLVLALIWGLDRSLKQRLRMPFTRLDALAFGFLALIWFGALRSQAGSLAYASATMYSLGVIGFYVVSHAVQSKEDLRLVLTVIIVGFALQAVYVSAQMATHSFLTLPGAKVAPVGTQGINFEA